MHTPQHPYDDGLREQVETQFEALYGHLSDPLVVFDLSISHTPMVLCNELYAQMHGYSRDEILGAPLDVLNGSYIEGQHDDARERANTLKTLRHEGHSWGRAGHVRKDGSPILIEYSNRLITLAGRDLVLSVEHQVKMAPRQSRQEEFKGGFQEFFHFLRDGALLVDPHTPDLRILDCNEAFAKMNDCNPADLIGTPLGNLNGSQDEEAYQRWLRYELPGFLQGLKLQGSLTYNGAYKRLNGTVYPVAYSHSVVILDDRELLLYIVRDTSEEQHTFAIERQRDEVLDAIAHNAPLSTTLERVTSMLERQIRHSRCAVLLRQGDVWRVGAAPSFQPDEIDAITALYAEEQPDEVKAAFIGPSPVFIADVNLPTQQTPAEKNVEVEPRLPQYDSLKLTILPPTVLDTEDNVSAQCVPVLEPAVRACWMLPVLNSQHQNIGVLVMFLAQPGKPARTHDVEMLKRAASLVAISVDQHRQAEMLAHQAEHDYLTDLPNRLLFEDRLRQSILRAKRHQQLFGVLFVDLDGFKHINDTLGHNAGDLVLMEVARRLRNCVRSSDTVARLGGDEFTLLLNDLQTPDDAAQIAQKVLDALQKPLEIMQHEVFVTGSVGISLYPRDGDDDGALLRHADAAMYNAKSSGKNQYAFFKEAIGEAIQETQNLKVQLRRAFEQKQFEIFYQPVISLADGRIESFEALLRWHHPRLGTMLPVSFIPAAEETGIILKIGEWMLHEVCSQIARWQSQGWKTRVSVNISALQLVRTQLVDVLKEPLSEYSLTPDCLELELAESVLMRDMSESKRQLESLRRYGVKLAIDDFGTGYSSLAYLQKLPLHRIKIDQSFVKDLEASETGRALVDAIVRLGHGLNLNIVAEGVSNAGQMNILRELGCDFIQGFHVAMPLCAEDATRFLDNQSAGAIAV